jgi:sulfur-carrier protein
MLSGLIKRHTVCPSRANAGTNAVPTNPLDPVTRTFIFLFRFFPASPKSSNAQNATQPPLSRQAVESFETLFFFELLESPIFSDAPGKLSLLSASKSNYHEPIYAPATALPLALAGASLEGYNLTVPSVSQTVHVKVLFFGRLKEIVGHAEDSIDLPNGSSIEALFSRYVAPHPELIQFRPSLVASRNQEFAAWNTPLHSGDEVAFLPPVSGG